MAATSTYLTITNNTINESGADLATFAANGSDWSTNTNAMLNRFKTWVARAWKQIQVDAYDWEFMQEQGVCNIDPGIMFYTDGTAISSFSSTLANSTFNIYDQNGTVAIPSVNAGNFTDLTGTFTNTLPFGYFNLTGFANGATPLNIALKPGAEFFVTNISATFTDSISYAIASGFKNLVNNSATFNPTLSSVSPYYVNYTTGNTTYKLALYTISNTSIGFLYNSATQAAAFTAMFATTTTPVTLTDVRTGATVASWTGFNGSAIGTIVGGSTQTVYRGATGYVHSWKSFDFDEELGSGDFQEIIQEIDPTSFRIVDFFKGAPTGEVPVPVVPWDTFRSSYDLSSAYPGLPRVVTEDDTGRWRFYPSPYYTSTIKFDYVRQPQILSASSDLPRGINDDFIDLIMWRALMFYGQYDEQPSVEARAEKNYKNLLSRLELKNRPKFRFKPVRLY